MTLSLFKDEFHFSKYIETPFKGIVDFLTNCLFIMLKSVQKTINTLTIPYILELNVIKPNLKYAMVTPWYNLFSHNLKLHFMLFFKIKTGSYPGQNKLIDN